jgi:hypothetical protein
VSGYDQQMMVADESTFGTKVTVTKGFPYNGDPMPLKPIAGRTETNPMRPGTRARRQARVVPYAHHAEGHVDLDWMSKDMSFWLKHLLGTVGTTGSGPYVHTGTEGTTGALMGKSFTAQFNAPFHPAGTNQAVTFGGCKVPKWTLGCDTDGMLVLGLDLWAANWTTGTALATYAETASQVNFAWAHGAVTVAGTQLDLDSFTVEVDQGMNVDRRQIRGNTEAKEPSLGELAITASMTADFESLTQFNRVHATSVSSLSAAVVATFTNGSDIVTATIPGFRFDELSFSGDRGALKQELSGVAEWDGTNSPISLAVTSSQTLPG